MYINNHSTVVLTVNKATYNLSKGTTKTPDRLKRAVLSVAHNLFLDNYIKSHTVDNDASGRNSETYCICNHLIGRIHAHISMV